MYSDKLIIHLASKHIPFPEHTKLLLLFVDDAVLFGSHLECVEKDLRELMKTMYSSSLDMNAAKMKANNTSGSSISNLSVLGG